MQRDAFSMSLTVSCFLLFDTPCSRALLLTPSFLRPSRCKSGEDLLVGIHCRLDVPPSTAEAAIASIPLPNLDRIGLHILRQEKNFCLSFARVRYVFQGQSVQQAAECNDRDQVLHIIRLHEKATHLHHLMRASPRFFFVLPNNHTARYSSVLLLRLLEALEHALNNFVLVLVALA